MQQSFAQDSKSTSVADTTTYTTVDTFPSLVAADQIYKLEHVQQFIRRHIKWPDPRIDCSGSVVISFIVEKNGTVSSRKFNKTLCPKFDEEAMRLICLMNRWSPGVLHGEHVRTLVVVPVQFKIH